MRVESRVRSTTGYVPVVHIGNHLEDYTDELTASPKLSAKSSIALGAIVPNLLRKPKAIPYTEVLSGLQHVRTVFEEKTLHVFGVGGTATLHLMALLGIDSADSSGWRNRAARGIIQYPGSGDRLVASLGNWARSPPILERVARSTPMPVPGLPEVRRRWTEGEEAPRLLLPRDS